MLKKIMKSLIVIIFIVIIVSSNVFGLVIRAEETGEQNYEHKYGERNELYYETYGITYEDLFYHYPSALNCDTEVMSGFHNIGRSGIQGISTTDEIIAACMQALSNTDIALSYSIRNCFSSVGMTSPYEKQLDDVTTKYITYVLGEEKSKNQFVEFLKGVDDKYKDVKKLISLGESIEDEDYYINLGLDKYKDVLSKEEMDIIREMALGKKDYIEFEYKDLFSETEYFLFIIELCDIDQQMIKLLLGYQSEGSVLQEGLQRYLDDYENCFIKKNIDKFAEDLYVSKVADALISYATDSANLQGAWGFVTIIIDFVADIYEDNAASATEITKYYIMEGFVNNMSSAVDKKMVEMHNNLQNGKDITREDIDEYEILYNAYIKTMQMYIETAEKLVSSSEKELIANIQVGKVTLKENYSYDVYIDMCMRNIKGEEITFADVPIYTNRYTINEGESLTIASDGNGGFTCTKINTSGEQEDILVINNKQVGGITLNGGTIHVHCDANISALIAKNNAEVVIDPGYTLTTDKLTISGNATVYDGTIKSVKLIEIGRESDYYTMKINGVGNVALVSDKIKLGYGYIDIGDITLTANTISSTSKTDWYGNNIINGDINGYVNFIGGTTKVNGCLGGNISGTSTNINAKEVNCSSLKPSDNFSLNVEGDLTFSGAFYCESDTAYISVGGNVYDYGYTGGWRLLSTGYSKLNNGTLVIEGNLYGDEDKEYYSSFAGTTWDYTFYAGKDFNLIFKGGGEHLIDIPAYIITGTITSEGSLKINTYDYDCEISGVKSDVTLVGFCEDLIINNGEGYTITVNGEIGKTLKVTGANVINPRDLDYVLNVVDGDLEVIGDVNKTLSITGGVGKIYENAYASVSADNASLYINGKFDGIDIKSVNNAYVEIKDDCTYSGRFTISGDETYLYVGGNLYANGYTYISKYNSSEFADGGTIEIEGNLIAGENYKESDFSGNYTCKTFYTTGTCKLYLSGEETQIVNIPSENYIAELYSDGAKIQIPNTINISQITSDINLDGTCKIINIKNGNENTVKLTETVVGTINISNGKLKSDAAVNCNSNVSNGNLEYEDDVNGYIILDNTTGYINGNVNLTTLTLINSSYLEIAKDCTYSGRFTITGDETYLYVGGNLYANGYTYMSKYNSWDYADGGTIELKGDLIASYNYRDDYLYRTFYTTGTCKLLLSGEETQAIDIPSTNYITNIQQTGTNSIEFVNPNVYVTKLHSDLSIMGDNAFVMSNLSGWNDYTVTTPNRSVELIKSYPSHYEKITQVSEEDTGLTTYVYKPGKLTIPSASPVSGTVVDKNTEITLSHCNNTATIYYTTDGTEPTNESLIYSQPISFDKDTEIKFMAAKDNCENSDIVTASYTIKKYNVTIDSTLPDEFITVSIDTAYEGDTITIEINDIPGRTYVDDSLTVKNGSAAYEITYGETTTFVMPRGNVVVSAKYTNNEYNIIYNTDEGILPDNAVATYTYSIGATLPIPVKTGYRFEGWFDNVELSGEPIETISTTDLEDKEFWAKWVEKDTITIDEKVQEYVFSNEEASFEIVPSVDKELNYIITYYQDDTEVTPINTGVYDVKVVKEEDNLYKYFETYLEGALVIGKADATLNTTPETWDLQTGKALSESVIDGAGKVKIISNVDGTELEGTFQWVEPDTIVQESAYYQAKFVPTDNNYNEIPMELYVVVSGEAYEYSLEENITQGIVLSGKSEYFVGENVIIEIQPNKGYEWNQEIVISNGENELVYEVVDESHVQFRMPAGDVEITVGFDLCVYGISSDYDDTKGVLTGPDSAEHGSSVTFEFVPAEGYYILGITANDETVEHTDGTFTVDNITGDVTLSITCGRRVDGVSLDVDSAELYIGDTIDLESTTTPTDATNPETTWSSDNEDVAVVDEYGIVTAVGSGTATITATANDGSGVSASCTVTVTELTSEEPKPDEPTTEEPKPEEPTPDTPKSYPTINISYRTHIQSFGWEGNADDIKTWKSNGTMSGTSGKAKRLEGINIIVDSAEAGKDVDLGIQYTTHCQSYGWLPWSADGDMNGTEGEAKRLEAIKIQLTGADKDAYDVYYRVHAQSYGWLGWAKNGEPSGTAGYAKRLEGIQIVVVKKGESFNQKMEGITSARTESYIAKEGSSPIVNYPATSNTNPVIPGADTPNVAYRPHVQSFGWQGWKYNGQMSGTSGLAKRLEGININLTNKPYEGDIVYTTHIQKYGWKDGKPEDTTRASWKKNGQMSGTSGEAKRLEAICIDLTGEMAEHYDIYYRVHAQTFGWLGWAKNGQESGTAGYAKRLEGIQIVLVPKGGAAPVDNYGGITSKDARPFISK